MAEEKRSKYARYTKELKEQAFKLYCKGETFAAIKSELNIGDSSGVRHIAKQDNWKVRREIERLNQTIDTVRVSPEEDVKTVALLNSPTVSPLGAGYEQLLAQRSKAVATARVLQEAARMLIEGGTLKFRGLREAWDIYREAIALEQKYVGASIEELFILRVFEVLKEEVTDQALLSRIADRLKLAVAQERNK
jgi:hypothetical protein